MRKFLVWTINGAQLLTATEIAMLFRYSFEWCDFTIADTRYARTLSGESWMQSKIPDHDVDLIPDDRSRVYSDYDL